MMPESHARLRNKATNADLAEPAGTLPSDPSLTQDIEPWDEDEAEDYQYGYAFLIGYGPDGLYIDTQIDVSPLIGKSYESYRAKKALLQASGRPASDDERAINAIAVQLKVLELRSRFMAGNYDVGPYLVKSPEELTPELLLRIIQNMSRERLKEVKL